ncbi:tetratricopeptide repeat protein [Streptomyces sp. 3MP-14]|uniref:Tetratricopeptide repeat protein n=1 Tax=Streptomyces mimosae TaxID=2586635 RepID=A0A5N6A7W3_9ACTN|nr:MULTISPECIES: tetratricopeptide repeat protein [Streptomyces]KAB8164701.1 tetratricopeptide repeat protein [Streptomyces mimosae]KAB8175617.1 tetratricopeptide repeat protein [Streptomyces sp. 3MP-14]
MSGGENPTSRRQRIDEAIALRSAGESDRARKQLLALGEEFPDDAEIAYQTACTHDALGLEAEALPFYHRAIDAGEALDPADRQGAFLGLGSSYRALGRYPEAVETLRRGVEEFPENGGLRTFLAMALHNTGEHGEAVRLLLHLLAATSGDPEVADYRKAIEYYADRLDETWPA